MQQAKAQQRSQLREDIQFLERELKRANQQLDTLSIKEEDTETRPPGIPPSTDNLEKYITLRQEDTPFYNFFNNFRSLGKSLGKWEDELTKDLVAKVLGNLRFALRCLYSLYRPLSLQEISFYLSSINAI